MTIDTSAGLTVGPIVLPARRDEDILIVVFIPAVVGEKLPCAATLEHDDDWAGGMGMTD